MSKKKKLALVFGRWQPLHNGHMCLFNEAIENYKHVLVFVGSSNKPRTPQNPFTADERIDMLNTALATPFAERLEGIHDIVPLPDSYLDDVWATDVRRYVNSFIEQIIEEYGDEVPDYEIEIVGHEKDDSSYYLHIFPEWHVNAVANYQGLNATDIRNELFNRKTPVDPGFQVRIEKYLQTWCGFSPDTAKAYLKHLPPLPPELTPDGAVDVSKVFRPLDLYYLSANTPNGVHEFLRKYMTTDNYLDMVEETVSYKNNKMAWGLGPYAPMFVTVDAVVTYNGHVLLIRRKQSPGRGLWALPGGFIDQDNSLQDNVIRELREETRISVTNDRLKSCMGPLVTFSDPYRSKRGRTITHASRINLDGHVDVLPKVRGDDDAELAKWFTFSEVLDFGNQLFEDHAEIIKQLVFSK